jgi:farnesyl-diphosphate farnesyltransferase
MLPLVSRTFALTIRLLPPSLGYTVTLAYLLCRIADTIEDASTITASDRVRLLARFRSSLGVGSPDPEYLRSAFSQPVAPDHLLVHHADRVLREFWKLPAAERDAISPSVEEMCDGMAQFVDLLSSRSDKKQMLETVAELEHYCYFVAGTVGHLLTKLFTVYIDVRALPRERAEKMWNLSTRFALGLQLTNIVQDVAADADRGVVYVPRELGTPAEGVATVAGGQPRVSVTAMNTLIERALSCLRDAIDYCVCVPRHHYRIRLFCLLAPYLAVRTLRSVRAQISSGYSQTKPKISRTAVYRTVVMTFLVAPSNTLLRAYFSQLSSGVALRRN